MFLTVLMIASRSGEASMPWWVHLIYALIGGLVWKLSKNRHSRRARQEAEDDQYADGGDDNDDARYYEGEIFGRNAGTPQGWYLRRRVRQPRHPVLLVIGMVAAAFLICIVISVVARNMGFAK